MRNILKDFDEDITRVSTKRLKDLLKLLGLHRRAFKQSSGRAWIFYQNNAIIILKDNAEFFAYLTPILEKRQNNIKNAYLEKLRDNAIIEQEELQKTILAKKNALIEQNRVNGTSKKLMFTEHYIKYPK